MGVAESPRRAEASSVSRENITLAVSLARRVLLEEFVSELLRLGYRCVKPTVRLLAFLIRTGFQEVRHQGVVCGIDFIPSF